MNSKLFSAPIAAYKNRCVYILHMLVCVLVKDTGTTNSKGEACIKKQNVKVAKNKRSARVTGRGVHVRKAN